MSNPLSNNSKKDRRIGMKRLLKLADFLETVPRERFDITVFTENEEHPEDPADIHKCGTTACALGWATQIKSLRDTRRAGLRLNERGMPETDFSEGFEAGSQVFALNPIEAYNLFSYIGYSQQERVTPKQAAKVIRSFAKKELAKL